MSASPEVAVCGLGLWLPGWPSLAAWRAGERAAEAPKPTGDALGRTWRRRAGLLGRALSDAGAEALRAAGVDPASVPTVVGSSIGEAATLVGLLDRMWRSPEPMSPAAFTVSVHNAASGVISIAAGNRGFTTSIAADFDTPAAALLEGVGLALAEDAPVLVACADEEAPRLLMQGDGVWDLLAAALVLAPPGWDGPRVGYVAVEVPGAGDGPGVSGAAPGADERAPRSVDRRTGAGPDLAPPELSAELALNPQAGLFDLVAALARGASGSLRLDRGAGRGFRAHVRPETER